MKRIFVLIGFTLLLSGEKLAAQTVLGDITTSSTSCSFSTTVCEGDTIQLTPSNTTDFTNFKWYFNTTAPANEITGVNVSQNVVYKSGGTIRIVNTGGTYILTAEYATPAGCAAQNDTFNINFNPRPTANPASATLCEAVTGGGQATFDLTTLNNTVKGGAGSVTVAYYATLADAKSASNALNASSYTSSAGTIYARVTNIATSCYNTSAITLNVNPKPTIADASTTICDGATVNLTSLITSYGSYSNPVWTLTTAGGSAVATPAAVTPSVTTTYVLVAENGSGCKDTANVVVTVNPLPTVTDPTDQIVCNNATTTAITFGGSAVSGTSYAWTNNTTSIGLAASGTGDIAAFTATNTTSSPVTATITVTPTANSCPGAPQTFTITVNPTPSVTDPTDQIVCNNATTTAITFGGSAVSGTSYAWTNNTTSIGLVASGTGDIAAFTATNTTANPVTATITVTPTANSCPGAPQTFTITVNPTPSVTDPTDQIVCNNATTTAITFGGSAVSGTSYAWTNNTTSIGLAASGTGDIAAFTATNATSSPVTATITVTPTANSCPGAPQTFTITVNPTPSVTDPTDQIVCNNATTTAITFAGSAVSGTSYAWTNNTTSIGLAGSGTGDIAAFTATNATSSPVTATITVTPTANSCPGTPQTFTITVNPTPSVTDPTDQIVCNNATTTAITFGGSTVSGTSYAWTNNTTSIGLVASGTGDIAAFTATNATANPVTATITVTPTANSCPGAPQTFTITVNPTPSVTDPTDQIVCNNATTTAITFSGSTVSGTSYAWTNNTTSIGLAASGTGDIAAFTATNATSSPVTATITVTPTANSCPGAPQTFTITVNPTPSVTDPTDQVVCNNATTTATTTAITFSGSTVSGTSYAWTNNTTSIGLAGSGTGDIAAFTATNATANPVTATITVTPTANSCPGTPQTFTITVNPAPSVTDPTDQVVCNNATTTAITFGGSAVSGTSYAWTNNTTSIGLAASGTGDIAAFTATNATANPVTATFTVTPTANSCPGTPQTFTITVNPNPDFTLTKPVVCPGSTEDVTITNLTGAVPATATYKVDAGSFIAYPVPAIISGLSVGSHNITVKSMEGCETTKAININSVAPKICVPVSVIRVN